MEQLIGILEEIKPGFVFTGRDDLVDSAIWTLSTSSPSSAS